MYVVIVEWDGKQAPTAYYSALHNLSLRVRGDKEFEPIVRRAGEYNKAVIVQEGAVLVPSESLAKQVAYLAKREGARSVMFGDVELDVYSTQSLTPSEQEVILRFSETFQKRGRPSVADAEEKDWVITCPECVHTSIVTARKAIQCPRCGGLRVSARVGVREQMPMPRNTDEWAFSRFMSGNFEIPNCVLSGAIQGHYFRYKDDEDIEVINNLVQSTWVSKTHNWDLLDMVFCARRYYDYDDRQNARVACCMELYKQGFSQSQVSLFEQDSVYEPIDAAIFYVGNYEGLINIYKHLI